MSLIAKFPIASNAMQNKIILIDIIAHKHDDGEVKPNQLFTRFDPVNCVPLKPRVYEAISLLLIH